MPLPTTKYQLPPLPSPVSLLPRQLSNFTPAPVAAAAIYLQVNSCTDYLGVGINEGWHCVGVQLCWVALTFLAKMRNYGAVSVIHLLNVFRALELWIDANWKKATTAITFSRMLSRKTAPKKKKKERYKRVAVEAALQQSELLQFTSPTGSV